MKLKALLSLSLASMFFSACNGVGPKDELVARIGSENLYQADLDFIALGQRDWDRSPAYRDEVQKAFSKAALTSLALSKYPEIEKKWQEEFALLETRYLMIAYQRFFSMGNMMFSDEQLRNYYQGHQSDFAGDSMKSFMELRPSIAFRMYLASNADSLMVFKRNRLAQFQNADTASADTAFINEVKHSWAKYKGKELIEKYNVKKEPIPEPDLKAYYDAHQSEFMTVPAMVVYHIQSADSAKLAKKMTKLPQDSAAFMALASKFSENQETAAHGGFVGKVKKDYALPYGIGMVNGLFHVFEGKPAGSVSPILKSSQNAYHVFYLAEQVPAEQKSFDRAKKSVETAVKAVNYDLDSNFVLASMNGEPVVRERDVWGLYKMNPNVTPSNENRERIVDMLMEGAAFAAEARANKLDKSWEYLALVRQGHRDYVCDMYKDFEMEAKGFTEDSLRTLFESGGDPLNPTVRNFSTARNDIYDYMTYPKNLENWMYYRSYNSKSNLSEKRAHLSAIMRNLTDYRKSRMDRYYADAWKEAKIALYRDSLNFDFYGQTPENLVKSADSLYKMRLVSLAVGKLERLRNLYPEQDSLFAWATFQIAQMLGETDEDYEKAQGEYHAFYRMYPDHPNAEKAMFSRGFILDENLKRSDEALEVLEEFQQKYPKSELKESVDWLVENIKSNGKLADDLMKKISEE